MRLMHDALRALGTVALAALPAFPGASPPARAQAIDPFIRLGQHAGAVAVNPTTNRIYAATGTDPTATVSVIDGATHAIVATLPSGSVNGVEDIAVNPTTNRIYAADSGSFPLRVVVIDGASNVVIATVPVANSVLHLAVNPATNRVYVRHFGSVSVLDGATNTVVATIPVVGAGDECCVAANPATNRIYVSHVNDNAVAVIDGASNTLVATIPLEEVAGPSGLDVDPATNRLYVAVREGVAVIDGASEAVLATIPVGGPAVGVAFDPTNNRLYVKVGAAFSPFSGFLPGLLTVIDATTNTVVDAFAFRDDRAIGDDVAVNPATNRVYVPLGDLHAVWVTEEPPRIGGTRFGISPSPEGVLLTWSAGRVETGYSIARWGAASGTVDVLPRGGPLPAGTTSFTDVEPLPEAAYLYAVLPRDATGILWMSDLLGLQPNTQAGQDAPREFTLRHARDAQLDASTSLTMTWRAPGGLTGYVLVAMDSEGIDTRVLNLEDNTTGIYEPVVGPKCYMLFAAVGPTVGHTHSLCGLSLLSAMEATQASAPK